MQNDEMVKRNVELQAAFMSYILSRPEILDRLPEEYRLVILPDDDPELSRRNLELLKEQGDPDKPIVIVRMRSRGPIDFTAHPPQIFIPIAA